MTDAQQIRAMGTALIAWPCMLVILLSFRAWCRKIAAKKPTGIRLTRRTMTLRILRAMSWRAAIVLFVGIPAFLSLAGYNIEEKATYAGKGIGFAVWAYPLVILSLWQVARRISCHAFEIAGEELQSDGKRDHNQLLAIACVLDGADSRQAPSLHERHITDSAYCSGLRARRFRPTVVEGLVGIIAALMLGSLPLPIGISVLRARHAAPHGGVAKPMQVPAAEKVSVSVSKPQVSMKPDSPPLRVAGNKIKYSLALPQGWQLETPYGEIDLLAVAKNGRIAVIAEELAMESNEAAMRAIQESLKNAGSVTSFTRSAEVTIAGRTWCLFYAHGTVEGAPLTYRWCVYTGNEGTFQILEWTGKNVFSEYQPEFDTILRSFRFPERE